MEKYDLIISGSGLSGLVLLYKATRRNLLADKKILVVDKDDKQKNDRTWCFWHKGKSDFDDLLFRRWDRLRFYAQDGRNILLDNAPYSYKMIRSIDFYKHVLHILRKQPNIHFLKDDIESFHTDGKKCVLKTRSGSFVSEFLLNSIFAKPDLSPGHQFFLQHFKGVIIRSDELQVNEKEIHLMDFRTPQTHGTTFFYVLPFSNDEVFIEYTLFSKGLLKDEDYNNAIKIYISKHLGVTHYEVLEQEFGIIPMTDYPFTRREGNILNMGSIGGDTRGSTGYTFYNVNKTADRILESMEKNGHPFFEEETISRKHRIFDSTLLNVLDKTNYPGDQIFTDLFFNTRASTVFSFLDGESTLLQDLSVIRSVRPFPFLKHFMGALVRAH